MYSLSAVHLPFPYITLLSLPLSPDLHCHPPIVQGAVNFFLSLSPSSPFHPLAPLPPSQLSRWYTRSSFPLIFSLPLSTKPFCLLRAQLWIILLITSLAFIQQELTMIVLKTYIVDSCIHVWSTNYWSNKCNKSCGIKIKGGSRYAWREYLI